MNEQIEISYIDLALIIEGIYFGVDEDIDETEDLINYLHNNEDCAAILETY
ncbi:hypothetical protein WMU_01942 [Enterococcus faecalis EnGen0351]|uniref:hypothetical protein n=1 Tax=Enterococcus TaxID=1350 RepID=UPI00032F8D00|nr:hypothetical protein [Enterococcus faecalis]EOJ69777.1 hypothetical protein WMU_01942 [Enterococcus faecalis EnGen0351]NSR64106.1 hypothetical protein [Enterococcus faecalis]